jgi:hypothetical protein
MSYEIMDKMGCACGTMVAGKYIWEFGGKNLTARCQLEDLGKDTRMILKWIRNR